MPPKRDCRSGQIRAHRGNDKKIYCRRFERVFFGKMDNAAETVWLICRQGDSSPNRQYFSEPFEDVLLRGHCSEVVLRDEFDPMIAAGAMQLIVRSLDLRAEEAKLEHEAQVKKDLLKKHDPKKFVDIYCAAQSSATKRRRKIFVLRTIYLLRVPMLSHPDTGSNDAMLELGKILAHSQCFVACIFFSGCDFDDSSTEMFASYLESEPFHADAEKDDGIQRAKDMLNPQAGKNLEQGGSGVLAGEDGNASGHKESIETPDGLRWEEIGKVALSEGHEVKHLRLTDALCKKLKAADQTLAERRNSIHSELDDEPEMLELTLSEFSQVEIDVTCLSYNTYVKVGDRYFKPARPIVFENPQQARERRRKQMETERLARLIREEEKREEQERPQTRSKGVRVLYLRRAHFSLPQILRLTQALKKNKNLQQLDMGQNSNVGDKGAAALALALTNHPRLWSLALQDCHITAAGAEKLRVLAFYRLEAEAAAMAEITDHLQTPQKLGFGWGLNRSASDQARRDQMSKILADSPAKDKSNDGQTPSGLDQGENKEAPGRKWRTSEGKALFKASVTAVMAGEIIRREAITSKMKPGLPEIAHVGRFRVVLGSIQKPVVIGVHEHTSAAQEARSRREREEEEKIRAAEEAEARNLREHLDQAASKAKNVRRSSFGLMSPTSGQVIRSPLSTSALTSPMMTRPTKSADGVVVGVVMSEHKKRFNAPTATGNKASSLMPWQQISKSPVMVLSKFHDSEESSTEEGETEEGSETKAQGHDLDDFPSLWGGGSHALMRIELIDGNRVLCAPRNSPGYNKAARQEAAKNGNGRKSSWGAYEFGDLEDISDQAASAVGAHSPYGRPRARGLAQLEMEARGLRKSTEGHAASGAVYDLKRLRQRRHSSEDARKSSVTMSPADKAKAERAAKREKRRREREEMQRVTEAEARRQELEGFFEDENDDDTDNRLRSHHKNLHHAWRPVDDALESVTESKGGVMKEKSG